MNKKALQINFKALEIDSEPLEIQFEPSEVHLEAFWEALQRVRPSTERAAQPPEGFHTVSRHVRPDERVLFKLRAAESVLQLKLLDLQADRPRRCALAAIG